jgi:hypothetical protein
MLEFFKLLLVCFVAGALATSLTWVFFWITGILRVPASIKRLFGKSSHQLEHRLLYCYTFQVNREWQAGSVSVSNFDQLSRSIAVRKLAEPNTASEAHPGLVAAH